MHSRLIRTRIARQPLIPSPTTKRSIPRMDSKESVQGEYERASPSHLGEYERASPSHLGEYERAKPSHHHAWIVCDGGESKRALSAQAGALCALWLHAPAEGGFPDTVVGHGSGALLLLFFFATFLRIMDAQQPRGHDRHARTTFGVVELGRRCTHEQRRNHVSLFLQVVCAFVTGPDAARVMTTHRLRRPWRWLCTDWTPEQRAGWDAFPFGHVLRECTWDRLEWAMPPPTPGLDVAHPLPTLGLYFCDSSAWMVRCSCEPRCQMPCANVWSMHRGHREPSSRQYRSMPDTFHSMYDWVVHRPRCPDRVVQFRALCGRFYDTLASFFAVAVAVLSWILMSTTTADDVVSTPSQSYPSDIALECALRQRSTSVHWTILDPSFAPPTHHGVPDFAPLRPTFTLHHWQLYDSRVSAVATHFTPKSAHNARLQACCARATPPSQPISGLVFRQCVNWGMLVLWNTLDVSESQQYVLYPNA